MVASRQRWAWAAGWGAAFVLHATGGQAAEVCSAPWQRLPDTGREFVRPVPLVLTGLSALTPIPLIPTGADHDLRVFSQTDLGGSYNPEQVSIFTPYVLYPSFAVFYGVSVLAEWCPGQKPVAAILQGTTLAALVYGTTKIVTGRAWPWSEEYARLDEEASRDFRPFQRLEQELGAFPSGHTAFMFAAAAAFRASSPELGWWRYAGYPFAFGMGFAMWFGDHHWFSDVLSGGLLGEAIGGAAGRAFAPAPVEPELTWSVWPTSGGALLSISGPL